MIRPKIGDHICVMNAGGKTWTVVRVESVANEDVRHLVVRGKLRSGEVGTSALALIGLDRFATDAEVLAAKLRGEL